MIAAEACSRVFSVLLVEVAAVDVCYDTVLVVGGYRITDSFEGIDHSSLADGGEFWFDLCSVY